MNEYLTKQPRQLAQAATDGLCELFLSLVLCRFVRIPDMHKAAQVVAESDSALAPQEGFFVVKSFAASQREGENYV